MKYLKQSNDLVKGVENKKIEDQRNLYTGQKKKECISYMRYKQLKQKKTDIDRIP